MSSSYGPQNPFPQQPPVPAPGTPAWNQQGSNQQGSNQQGSNQPGQPVWSQAGQGPYGVPPRQRNGLAITAIVLSVVALVAALGVAAFVGFSVAAGGPGVLQGKVEASGSTVAAAQLQSALTSVIKQDGGVVGHIECPDSSRLGQGLVAVCHGSVDDYDWTGIVVFEDDSGTFTLQEL